LTIANSGVVNGNWQLFIGRRPAILMHNDDELAEVLALIEPLPAMGYAP
jgi:hypothetical protein